MPPEAAMPVVANPHVTADDFALLPDADRFELLDGELVEREMSNRTTTIGGDIFAELRAWCRPGGRGFALPDGTTFRCFAEQPDRVRKPDASWFSAPRWTPALFDATHIDRAPDLIVEVLSPHDLAYDVSAKVDEFFRAGTAEAWVVHPHLKQLDRQRADQSSRRYGVSETLDGGPLLPGFALRLAEVFARIG
jgi:Uma2 family endonuclease